MSHLSGVINIGDKVHINYAVQYSLSRRSATVSAYSRCKRAGSERRFDRLQELV